MYLWSYWADYFNFSTFNRSSLILFALTDLFMKPSSHVLCGFLNTTYVECSSDFIINVTKTVYCLSCFLCPAGDGAIGQLFRVQDANLRARVALQALERWPLPACLELLEFCLNDPNTETSLRTDLELKKKELDIYHWVMFRAWIVTF